MYTAFVMNSGASATNLDNLFKTIYSLRINLSNSNK
jgi:hypothetical protein